MQAVNKAFLFLLNLLFVTQLIHAQTANVSTDGGNTPTSPTPSELNEGGHTTNVNLFTGTLQTSYELGTVSSPSGLSFSASLNYSSNYVVGTEIPHLVGVPYGEGWNLSLPTISVKTEDFNKFTQAQLNQFSAGSGTAPFTSTFDVTEMALEGQQFDYAFHFSVPGVASGRLVYKYFKDGEAVFVPHTFDQYLEARYKPGVYWHIHLSDGTIYELNFVNVVTIAGANQRTKQDFVNPNSVPNRPLNAEPHNVLPSTQVGTWYCTKKISKNLTGEINFYYNSFGCLDYFPRENGFNSPNSDIGTAYNGIISFSAQVPKACSDVIISSIESESERLAFNYSYSSDHISGTGDRLLPTTTTTKLDEMYYKSTIHSNSTLTSFANSWNRYLHVMSNEAQNFTADCPSGATMQFTGTISSFDPYKGLRNNGFFRTGRVQKPMGGTGHFGHAFIESPGISLASCPSGDRYEVAATIDADESMECLFDFNLVTGVNPISGQNCTENIPTSNLGIGAGQAKFAFIDQYKYQRSIPIFSTFHHLIKPNAFFGQNEASYVFTMPSLPSTSTLLFAQIGPAVSDIDHLTQPSVVGQNGGQFRSLQAYFTHRATAVNPNYDNLNTNPMRSGEKYTPGSFGIGLPYFTARRFYGGAMLGLVDAAGAISQNRIWWQVCPPSGAGVRNRPTAAFDRFASPAGSTNFVNTGSKIRNFRLTRISKVPYMLKTVEKQVFYPNYEDPQGYKLVNAWVTASSLSFSYEVKHMPRMVYSINNNAQTDQTSTPPVASTVANGLRNVVLLKSITSAPITTIASGYNVPAAPKTQYDYTLLTANTSLPGNTLGLKHGAFFYNQYVLNSIVSPLGKQETVQYYPIKSGVFPTPATGAHDFSFTVLKTSADIPLQNISKEELNNTCADAQGNGLRRPVSGLNLELNLLVQSISVVDAPLATPTAHVINLTEYTYDDLVFFDATPNLGNNFIRNGEERDSDVQYGFKKTTTKGPERKGILLVAADIRRNTTIYFHKTTELPEALLWGKLWKVEEYFQDPSNPLNLPPLLHSRKEIEYEAILAYENIWHRGRKQTVGFDYDDYYTVAAGLFGVKTATVGSATRPLLAFGAIQSATVPNMATYYSNVHNFYGIGSDHGTAGTSDHAHSSHLSFDNSNQGKYGAIDFFGAPVPTFYNSVYLWSNYLAVSNPVVRRFTSIDEASRPHMCNSYFVKKTKETNERFDFTGTITTSTGLVSVSSNNRSSIKTITEYKYFDADYAGRSNSPGYKEIGLTLQSDGLYHLYWEPSWQLYSKLTYSPDMHAVIDSSYSKEEYFYYYDLANVPSYQINNGAGSFQLKSNDSFGAIYRAWAFGQLRSISYETRKTNKVLGSATPIVKSEYMIYSDGWEASTRRDAVDWKKVAQNDWPTRTITDRAIVFQGGLSSPSTRFCNYGTTTGLCNLSGITPDVACPCTGFGVSAASIDASLTLGNTNPLGDIEYRLRQKFSLKGKFLLDRVVNQLSTPTVSPSPIMRFNTSGDPVYPQGAQTLTSLTINKRNHFGQISTQTDAKGLVTLTVFPQVKAIEMKRFVNRLRVIDVMYLNANLGMPSSITIGAGETDAQTTSYQYYPENSIKQVTDPNATQLNYTYDYFGRLDETKRGTVLLSKVTYGNFSNDNTLSFKLRSAQNWVKTETYFGQEPNASGTLVVAKLEEKQYIDPFGRKVAKYQFNQFANNYTVLEDVLFDTWGTPSVSFKPSSVSPEPLPSVGVGSLPTSTNTYAHSFHDNTPDARVYKAIKYGNDGLSGKVMEMKYFNLTKLQVNNLLASTNAGMSGLSVLGEKFTGVWTKDEDGKCNVVIQDALGQTVSTILIDDTNSGNASFAATLLHYNEFGAPRTVWNPKAQKSEYYYNYFGKLFRKVSVDEGINDYAYNSYMELIGTKDAKQVTRVFVYDKFGRQIWQARSTYSELANMFMNNGQNYHPSLGPYFNIINNPANYVFEKRTFFKEPLNWFTTNAHAASVTLINAAQNRNGRPAMTMAYSPNGAVIEAKYFSYNSDGFVQWEINQFNYNGITPTAKGLAIKTEYPTYQRHGSPKRIMVDLDINGTQEFQYAMNYDSYGRLACVKADHDPVATTAAFKVAEFSYNDPAGKVSVKKYFDHHPTNFTCNDNLVETVTYNYDVQFRITDLLATLFDWQLKYDGANFPSHTANTSLNYNGNVNSTYGNYKFSTISPVIPTFAGAESGTYYNYRYDKYNRLINADAKVGSQTTAIGDEVFVYDKIGNITSATRTSTDFSTTPTTLISNFAYGATNNRLGSVSYGGNPPRSFTYDLNGNLSSDTKSTLSTAIYNRGNTLASATTATGNIAYLYNTSDSRVFKHRIFRFKTDIADYYLKSSSGLDLAVFNMNTNKFNWYVYGASGERVAQVAHPTTTVPVANKLSESDIKVELADESIWDEFKSADFFDEKFVFERYPEHPIIEALLRLRDKEGKLLIPNILYVALDEKGYAQKAFLATDEGLELSAYKFIDTIPIDGLHTPIALRSEPTLLPGTLDDYYEPILIIKPGEILGLLGQDGKSEKKQGSDDILQNTQARALAPSSAPQAIYYLNDHLGNTRVTFHTDVCINGTTITRYIDHAIDYYPYGKTLREYFTPARERYLTTQHERDTETGYDNRGARLYDADVMRFLSVDPLAADYAAWSSYHYAANNPIIITDPTGREWSETNKELAEMYGVFGRGQGTDRDALRLLEEDNNDVCPECLTWLLRSYDSFKEYKFTWFLDYEVSLGAQFGAEVNILTPLSGNTKLGRGSKLFGLGGHASLFKASLFGNKVGVLGLSNAKPIYSPFGYDYKAKTVPVTQSIGFNFLGLGGEYEKSFLAYLSGGGYSKLGSNSEASLNLGASEINALSDPPVQSYLLKTGVDFKLLLGLKFEVNFGFTKQ